MFEYLFHFVLSQIFHYMTPLDYCGGVHSGSGDGGGGVGAYFLAGSSFGKEFSGLLVCMTQTLLALVFSRSFYLAVLENHNL